MLSPAAKHRLRTDPKPTVKPVRMPDHDAAATAKRAAQYEAVIREQFKADYHQMKRIKSRVRRSAVKGKVLVKYQGWLVDFMRRSSWTVKESSMFVWLMLWHIDAGDWGWSLELAGFAIEQGLSTPKDFERNLPEVVCEEIAGAILKVGKSEQYREVLFGLVTLVEGRDMTDPITAKLHKALGLSLLETEREQAQRHFEQALKLNPGVGVKRHLQTLKGYKRKPKRERPNLDAFSLSANAAAKLANLSTPAFLRHARKYPERLPHLEIPVGKRTYYRFNPHHVRAYLKNHLIEN